MPDRGRAPGFAAAMCLALGALSFAQAAVTMSRTPGLQMTRQPDGALLVRLDPATRDVRGAWPLVASHERPRLRVEALAGGGAPAVSPLGGGRGEYRSGLTATADELRRGILLREEGADPPAGALRDLAAPDPWAARSFARLETTEAGLTVVTREWLARRVPGPWPDPRTWTLVHNGRAEPMLAVGVEDGSFDAGDRLVFWAEPTRPEVPELGSDTRHDPWCGREIYFLASDGTPGLRLLQETGEIVETDPDHYTTPTSFPATILCEEEAHFSRLTYVLAEPHPDHHLWTTGIYGGELRSVSFRTPGLDRFSGRPAALRVCLRGLTAPTADNGPDVVQRMRLYVNNQGGAALEVGADGLWRNQGLEIASFGAEVFPDHTAFNDGVNTLYLAGVDEPPAGEGSAAMLNWLEVDYQRRYEAEDGWLAFTADPGLDGQVVNFEVSGFPDGEILVLKIGRSHLRSPIIRRQGAGWRLRFQDEFHAGTRYVAAAGGALREPAAAEAVSGRGLAAESAGAGVLVVLADSLMRAGGAAVLAPLLEGLPPEWGGARIVSDRWVYDEFSHGRMRPHAIRDWVARAWAGWGVAPRWLLLVGDGVLAPRAVVPGREPVLPLIYEQVYKWGAASSDDWYTRDSSGAPLPVLVSRWPAATVEDLRNLVLKAESYHDAAPAPWRNRLLFASGAHPQDEGVFMQLTEELIRLRLPDRVFVRRINAGAAGGAYRGDTQDLVRLLDEGVLVANYTGHGGGATWGQDNLFLSEDVAGLDNAARLPFVTNATCFIASLDYQGALGRALLNTGPMGAIGVLGSTGLGFRDMGMELVADFLELAFANPGLSVTALLREAKQRLWLRHVAGREGSTEALQATAVATMTTILGLPWQQLPLPGESFPRLENPVAVAGEVLRVSGETDLPGAVGELEVYSAAERPAQAGADFIDGVMRVPVAADGDGAWQAEVTMPDSLPGGGGTASLRVWLPTRDGRSASGFTWCYNPDSLGGLLLWHAGLLPEPPRPGEAFAVQVLAAGPDTPDSMAALIRAWPPAADSVDARLPVPRVEGDPQRWRSAAAAGPWPDSTVVRLQFVLYRGGEPDSTTWAWYMVTARRPLLEWHATGERDEFGRALLAVRNGGEADSDSLDLVLRDASGATAGTGRLGPVPAGGVLRATVALDGCRLGDTLWVAADWDPRAGGPHPAPLALRVEPLALRGAAWREVAPGLSLRLPAAGERALLVSRLEADLLQRQPALRTAGGGWLLQWADGGAPDPVEGRLSLAADSAATARADLLAWHAAAGLALTGIDGTSAVQRGDSLVFAFTLTGGDGLLAGWLEDAAPPQVRLEVEGQVFSDGDFVPPAGVLSWQLEDPAGVDPRPGRIALAIAGETVAAEDMSLSAESGRLGVQVQLDPGLPRGELTEYALSCRDAAGNALTSTGGFRLGEALTLRYAGAYPNPFQRETRFVFSLTGSARSATIDIFTVSGRRVRRLEIPGPLINYVETVWDGRDRVGDVVANGVYFYRLRAAGEEGRVDYIGKVARLK